MSDIPVYVGIGGSVLALDASTGQELWRQKINSGATYTTVALVRGRLFATASGELWCLDPATGTVIWHNRLKGLGVGYVSIAGAEGSGAAMAGEDDTAAVAAATSVTTS
jgi:outer membrane protein assembly factor BamB